MQLNVLNDLAKAKRRWTEKITRKAGKIAQDAVYCKSSKRPCGKATYIHLAGAIRDHKLHHVRVTSLQQQNFSEDGSI